MNTKTKNNEYGAFVILKKTLRLIPRRGVLLFFCILSYVLASILGIIVPIFTAKVIVNITEGLFEKVLIVATAVCAIQLLDRGVMQLRSYLTNKLRTESLLALQNALIVNVMRIKISELNRVGTGKIVERVASDAEEISKIIGNYAYWIVYAISNLGALVTTFILSREMFVCALAIALLCFLGNLIRVRKSHGVRKMQARQRDVRTGTVSEIVRGLKDIKSLNAGQAMADRSLKIVRESRDLSWKESSITRIYTGIEDSIYIVCELIFIAFGVLLCKDGKLAIPTFIILYNYLNQIRNLFYGISGIVQENNNFRLAGNRVFEIIDGREFEKEQFGDCELENARGEIELKDVSFGYDRRKKVIKHLSMHVMPNEKVAIVGRSGAGKSTVLNLLMRIDDVSSGQILLDGVPIKELSEKALRNNISVVTQSPYIFNFSVKDNLLIANPKATMREIREVCRLACIDDFIMHLPQKYNTMLGEGGTILSGGQKQRIAIARALLTNTKIILLDEATSALDNETQAEIQNAMANLRGDFTLIVVAHRLSTVIDSDRIFVMDDGELVASGTHRELLNSCELYKNLYSKDLTESDTASEAQ